ncbi:MAG: hypothetical protein JO276_02130 [Sphingomonadaceae bacterium]|nr:hypothetical protein [Sphingomonadaceae bacterium]
MRRILPMLVLLAGACEQGHPPPRQPPGGNAAAAAPAPTPARAAPIETPRANANEAPPEGPAAPNPAAAGLSPAQRRAYELGYGDCSQGRYAPGNHLEAYRIGCAAANDH